MQTLTSTKRTRTDEFDGGTARCRRRFTDGRGRPLDYSAPNLGNEEGPVATNGRLYEAVLERLALLAT